MTNGVKTENRISYSITLPLSYPAPQRAFDIFGAILGLIIMTPFLPLVYALVKIDSRGPLFVGLDRISEGRVVKIYKFRTMINGALREKAKLAHLNERLDGPFFKIRHDPRVTKVGRWLRKFRLDEFPQFYNVLKGELALVGPRPHEPEEVEQYPTEFAHITLARAGVTGLSQVSGASSLPFIKELELDSYYVKNQSIFFDLKIISRTAKILFSDPTAV